MAGQVGMLGWPSKPLSAISKVRSDNLRLVRDAGTVIDVARMLADLNRVSPQEPPRNPIVARLIALKVGEATTVYAAGWPSNPIGQAKRYGGDFHAKRLGENTWRVERIA